MLTANAPDPAASIAPDAAAPPPAALRTTAARVAAVRAVARDVAAALAPHDPTHAAAITAEPVDLYPVLDRALEDCYACGRGALDDLALALTHLCDVLQPGGVTHVDLAAWTSLRLARVALARHVAAQAEGAAS